MQDLRVVEYLVVVNPDPDQVLHARTLLAERTGDGRQGGPSPGPDIARGTPVRAYPNEIVRSRRGSMAAPDHLGWPTVGPHRRCIVRHLPHPFGAPISRATISMSNSDLVAPPSLPGDGEVPLPPGCTMRRVLDLDIDQIPARSFPVPQAVLTSFLAAPTALAGAGELEASRG